MTIMQHRHSSPWTDARFGGPHRLLLVAVGAAARPDNGPNDVVATVGSTSITLAQVDDKALRLPAESFGAGKLFQILYEARRAALDDIIGNLLIDQEAKARGIDRAALVEQEIVAKVSAPTDADVAAWYQANQARVQGAKLEQVRAPIKTLLIEQRTRRARDQYLDQLKTQDGRHA